MVSVLGRTVSHEQGSSGGTTRSEQFAGGSTRRSTLRVTVEDLVTPEFNLSKRTWRSALTQE